MSSGRSSSTALSQRHLPFLAVTGVTRPVHALLLEVLLVVVLGLPERWGRVDRGGDRTYVVARLVALLLLVRRELLLLVVGVEDYAAILRAEVRALRVHRRRVVVLEEDFEQFLVADLGRVVSH